MKNILKIALIIIGILIILCILAGAAYYIKFNAETKLMKPLETKEVIQGVYAIQDNFVNLFLVKNQDTFIAIDTGKNSQNAASGLQRLNIDPLKVKAIFLTHSHFDHTGGLSLFKNALIFLTKNENLNLKRDNEFMTDNSIINIDGIKVQCIFTPGHTPGSACYLVNDNILFAGDTLSLKDGYVETFNNFFNSDTKLQIESQKKLKKLSNIKYLLSSHYGFTDNYNKAFEKIENK